MFLYHITERRLLGPIKRTGLRPDKARGILRAVWFVEGRLIPWAVDHVTSRRSVNVDDIVILQVTRSYVKQRYGPLPGLHYSFKKIPAPAIRWADYLTRPMRFYRLAEWVHKASKRK